MAPKYYILYADRRSNGEQQIPFRVDSSGRVQSRCEVPFHKVRDQRRYMVELDADLCYVLNSPHSLAYSHLNFPLEVELRGNKRIPSIVGLFHPNSRIVEVTKKTQEELLKQRHLRFVTHLARAGEYKS
jgi:hypothetical protein